MYNSCYPKVAYTVDIVDIAALPEYSNYTYLLGDSVKVEDEQFFGTTTPITVIITEKTEDLDDPTKSKIKV
jgi:hypothetical protein